MEKETLPLSIASGSSQAPACLRSTVTLRILFELQDALRSDTARVTVLDISRIPYMNSAGMGAIINFFVSRRKNGCELIVAGPPLPRHWAF